MDPSTAPAPQQPAKPALHAAPHADPAHEEFLRFTLGRRLEHFALMTSFTLLVLTGLPQKFFDSGWAVTMTWLFGGLNTMRWIHRFCGFAMAALTVVHVAWGLLQIIRGARDSMSMVPVRRDFADAVLTLRYYLGLTNEQPKFDRYDYRQKWEYWGLVLGGVIMIVTGFILFLPVQAAAFLPGEVIPAAKIAHSNEGLMAFLVIIVWHVYNAHLNPDVFPFDKSIFTGKISRHRMEHEHPLELARIEAAHRKDEPPRS